MSFRILNLYLSIINPIAIGKNIIFKFLLNILSAIIFIKVNFLVFPKEDGEMKFLFLITIIIITGYSALLNIDEDVLIYDNIVEKNVVHILI